jgi:hypothetical protein
MLDRGLMLGFEAERTRANEDMRGIFDGSAT